jgi:hypothetical protein
MDFELCSNFGRSFKDVKCFYGFQPKENTTITVIGNRIIHFSLNNLIEYILTKKRVFHLCISWNMVQTKD